MSDSTTIRAASGFERWHYIPSPAPLERPTVRQWLRHTGLFLLTVATTTLAGVMLLNHTPEPAMNDPAAWQEYFVKIPQYYVLKAQLLLAYALHDAHALQSGLMFSAALLAILTAHEFGHYFACRRYRVDATLPFFLPAPPLFLTGTFGAFIKIKSPIWSRHALFDIGVAGPIAGFIVALPIAAAGVLIAPQSAPTVHSELGIHFHNSLLIQLLANAFGIKRAVTGGNPYYYAAWIGLLVTSLNLMPVGQLDGGHAVFAVFGARAHKWIGRIAFVLVASLTLSGWFFFNSPSGFLYTVLLGVMLKMRHPEVIDETPLDGKRLFIAGITFAIFVLSFVPFPITLVE